MKNEHAIPLLTSRQVAVFASEAEQLPQPSVPLITYSIEEQYDAFMTSQVSVTVVEESSTLGLKFVITGKNPKKEVDY
jgi:hypothetical protein